ncbi:MAG: hypothetical protein ACOYEV_15430 [Candidatus Nanopelagicales bacterium]
MSQSVSEEIPSPHRAVAGIALALAYSAAVLVASHNRIVEQVATSELSNPFRSVETLLVVVSIAVMAAALITPFLQSLAMRLLARFLRPTALPNVLQAWAWVLVSQVPYVAAVAVLYVTGGHSAAASIGHGPARIVFGWLTVALFSFLLARRGNTRAVPTVLFGCALGIVNTAFIMTAG